jgi:hypothetical protein
MSRYVQCWSFKGQGHETDSRGLKIRHEKKYIFAYESFILAGNKELHFFRTLQELCMDQ